MLEIDGIKIQWNGHDGYRLDTNNKIIYIDPFKLVQKYHNKNDADILCISHNHFDHLNIQDINNIINVNTKLICSQECTKILKENYSKNEIIPLKPGESIDVENIKIEATRAYNTNKEYHPKEDNKIGFVVHMDKLKIYHAGDTDLIPEMNDIDADIALVPVSGTYVMNYEEAAKAVNDHIKPKKMAIPMHYNSIVGSTKDADEFCNMVHVCKTTILGVE
ncbi:MAG TPA: MBL fold metallo-hydrolase [Verrucomicrobiae bacterium]|nr:MBL fold metallo-hydrolase [Verrucomicrobiae bacterium]